MDDPLSLPNMQSVFTFPFKDPQWPAKLLLGWLLLLSSYVIPVVPFIFLLGYLSMIMRQVILRGQAPSLPEWRDWGTLFSAGLRLMGVYLIYSAPVVLIFTAGLFFLSFPLLTTSVMQANGQWVRPQVELLNLGGIALGLGGLGLGFFLLLLLGLGLPAPLAHAAAHGELAAALRVRQWWPILRANLGGFLLIYFLTTGLGLAGGLAVIMLHLTLVLSCLTPLAASAFAAYHTLVSFVLYAQAYRAGLQQAAPAEPALA